MYYNWHAAEQKGCKEDFDCAGIMNEGVCVEAKSPAAEAASMKTYSRVKTYGTALAHLYRDAGDNKYYYLVVPKNTFTSLLITLLCIACNQLNKAHLK